MQVKIDYQLENEDGLNTIEVTGVFDTEGYLDDWYTSPRDAELTDDQADKIIQRLYDERNGL